MKKMKFLLFKNYMERIMKSRGTLMFQNIWFEVDGKSVDITREGSLSCALYVSSILKLFDLTKETHATVNGAVKDLISFGWLEIQEPRPGAILVWEKQKFADGRHAHIGFCLNRTTAISNSKTTQTPEEHSIDYNGTRKIEKILWHPKLDH